MKTAKALGLTVPLTLLAQAVEVKPHLAGFHCEARCSVYDDGAGAPGVPEIECLRVEALELVQREACRVSCRASCWS